MNFSRQVLKDFAEFHLEQKVTKWGQMNWANNKDEQQPFWHRLYSFLVLLGCLIVFWPCSLNMTSNCCNGVAQIIYIYFRSSHIGSLLQYIFGYIFGIFSVAMTTNVANPILYAWLNPTFKEMFLRTANPLLLRRKMRGQVNQLNNQSSSNQSKSRPSSAQTSSLGEGRLIVQMNNGGGSPRKNFFWSNNFIFIHISIIPSTNPFIHLVLYYIWFKEFK